MSSSAAPAPLRGRTAVSAVVERLARALEAEAVPGAVVIAVPRSIALARRVAAALQLPFEIAPVVTVGAAHPGRERAAATPDGHVYVWDSVDVGGQRLQSAVCRAVGRATELERRLPRRVGGVEGTWLLVARGSTGPAETAAALTWLRRHRNGRFVVAAAEWDETSASTANAWADRVVGAVSRDASRPRVNSLRGGPSPPRRRSHLRKTRR